MEEEAKAIQESAKAVQEVAKTAATYQPSIHELGSFFGRLMTTVEQGSGLIADYIKGRRFELAVKQEARIKALMEERGIKTIRPMPLSTAVPLIDAATLEDNEDIAEMFANLIVSHIHKESDTYVPKQFTETLKQLSPFQAAVLKAMGDAPEKSRNASGMMYTAPLPNHYWDAPKPYDRDVPGPDRNLLVALASLQQVGCIEGSATMGGYRMLTQALVTEFGRAFLDAVAPTRL
ncbi:Abi-alpha family protein [Rhizobium sp. BK377]|uniref:Abi-alpha family protein n=1 Tax=Rhizobium sp. BK377 TaxID=2587058 RepID=UPI00161E55E9|nr:Abi-alpha family protein [Rhizobium sp. BK377]MBB3460609.1 hypothetical protein [Rhizobium sp. BK377]